MMNFSFKRRDIPDFLIVGAQKAGTTSLFGMLASHPEIEPPLRGEKELHYFDDGKIPFGLESSYRKKFAKNSSSFFLEASPSYLYHPLCASRIAHTNPDAKIIVLLREPIARAYSGWSMYSRFNKEKGTIHRLMAETRTFEQAIEDEYSRLDVTSWYTDKRAYLSRSIYTDQILRYTNYFQLDDQLLLVGFEEFVENPHPTFRKILKFLGVDPDFTPDVQHSNRSPVVPTNGAPKCSDKITDLFARDSERLHEYFNWSSNWRINTESF